MRKRLSLAAALAAIGVGAWPPGGGARAESWLAFRKDEARTGYVSEQAAPPLTLRWTRSLAGGVLSSPAAAYGKVYVGARDKKVYALDAFSGAVLWSYETSDWVDASCAVSSGVVFAASRDGTIYALDAETGNLRWSAATGATNLASPVALEGELYAATGHPQRLVHVFDAATGALKRSGVSTRFTASSPVLDRSGGRLFLGASDGKYQAWNLSLQQRWSGPVPTEGLVFFATPALREGRLVLAAGGDDWTAKALDPATGAVQWTSAFLSNNASLTSSIAVSTDTVYLGSGSNPHSLYALSLSSGGVRWSLPLGAPGKYGVASSPAVANDVVYVLSPSGELYAVHTATGGVLARVALGAGGASSPAVADGWVYAATMDGKVHGLEAQRAASVASPDAASVASAEGIVRVRGTAASPGLSSYRVEFGSGASPTDWTVLATGTSSVTRGDLASWDTRELPDGIYTLRVRVLESSPSALAAEAVHPFAVSHARSAGVQASSGTVVTLDDGTEIDFPEGALAWTDTLSVRKLFSGYPLYGVAQRATATGIVREIKLAGTAKPRFKKPIRFKIPYHTYSPKKEENMRLFFYDEAIGEWSIVNTSVVKAAEKRIWADLDHFSLFQVMEFNPSQTLFQESEVYTFPNPARGNLVTFKFRLADAADVTIRVFDLSGGLVAVLEKGGNPAGIASTLDWNVGGKASGVYVYHFEARTASGTKATVIKKLAIRH